MKKKLKILICPLNWGLGHATRSAPIIEKFLEENHEIVIGGNGMSYEYLKMKFPKLRHIYINGININYGHNRTFSIFFFLNIPHIIINTIKENKKLKRIQKNENFDIIISDNRFGLSNKNILSIYMTHQTSIFLPGYLKILNSLATKVHRFIINKYSLCWIPDIEADLSISGKLSADVNGLNIRKIGILSRFSSKKVLSDIEKKYDFLFILSGPEPQRSIFEDIIYNKFINSNYKIVILRGKPGSVETKNNTSDIKFYNHVNDDEFMRFCSQSSTIVCRSGYSSIMDLARIKRKAVIVPTPGQTEQEYLTEHLSENFGFKAVSQKQFEKFDIEKLHFNENWHITEDNNALNLAVKELENI